LTVCCLGYRENGQLLVAPDRKCDNVVTKQDGPHTVAYIVGEIPDLLSVNFYGRVSCVAQKGSILVAEHFGEKLYIDSTENELTSGNPCTAWFVKVNPKKSAPTKGKEKSSGKGTSKGLGKPPNKPPQQECPLVCKTKTLVYTFLQPSFLSVIKHNVSVTIPTLVKNPNYRGPTGSISSPLELSVQSVPGFVAAAPNAAKKGKGKGKKIPSVVESWKLPEWKHCQHLFK